MRGGAERGLREIEVHHGLGVGRARRARLAATVAERVAAEERVEDVAEAERLATGGPPGHRRRAAPSSPNTS